MFIRDQALQRETIWKWLGLTSRLEVKSGGTGDA